MIQGGDPTGTGSGGESIWGKPFKDEFNSKLTHSGRGVVSMANSGPQTNGSQFFILYKSANHLNFKHTVFGNAVGGLTTLAAMEKVPVDDSDRPLVRKIVDKNAEFAGKVFLNSQCLTMKTVYPHLTYCYHIILQEEIKITSVTVFVNPYTEPDEEEEGIAEDEKKPVDDENVSFYLLTSFFLYVINVLLLGKKLIFRRACPCPYTVTTLSMALPLSLLVFEKGIFPYAL